MTRTRRDVARDSGHDTLLLFPGALGDAVCLEPALAWLARAGGVTMHARGAALEVAALFPARPELRSLDAPEIARLFAPEEDPAVDRWLGGYARIVSFTGAAVPHVAARLRAAGGVVAPFPRPPLPRHASACFLRAVGAPDDPLPWPRLTLRGAASPPGRPRLAVLPGAGGAAKRAPYALHAALAARWTADLGGQVDVLLGPAEADEGEAWGRLGAVRLPGSIADLAKALARASAFVGNDSGPSHVAAALGVPGVVLYATTRPADFGPRGPRVASVHVAGATPEAAWHAMCGVLP